MAENENIALQRLIFEANWLSTSEKIVALCLIWHRNIRTGRCNPGQATISRETGLKERSIRLAIHGLVSKNIVRATRTQKTTRYEFFGRSGSLDGLPASAAGLDRHLMPVGTNRELNSLEQFKSDKDAARNPMRKRKVGA